MNTITTLLKRPIDEFNLVRKEAQELRAMPEITTEQIAAKQIIREQHRTRQSGGVDYRKQNYRPGDTPITGIPPDAVSQMLYSTLLQKGASSDDAKMYVLNAHIGDSDDWNKNLLNSLK